MMRRKNYRWSFLLAPIALWLAPGFGRFAIHAATPASLAEIPGISAANCTPPSGERPWLDTKQSPSCRALEVIPQMTYEEKLAFRIALPRLGLNATAGLDGPYGLAGGGRGGAPNPLGQNVTTFPDELAVASSFDRDLAESASARRSARSSTAKVSPRFLARPSTLRAPGIGAARRKRSAKILI